MNATSAASQRSGAAPSRGGELHKGSPVFLALTAIGVVFGDIGTSSALYAFSYARRYRPRAADRVRRAWDRLADLLGADGDGVA